MLFNISGCLVKYPPLTFSHFNDSENFLMYLASSLFIEFSFPTATFDIVFSEGWVEILTGTKVVKATHCFKHSIAMRTKPIDTEAITFLLSACSAKALNFTIKSCTLKPSHDHISKLRVLYCQGVNLLVSQSISQRV